MKLASIEVIESVDNIEGADRIVACRILGYQTVMKKEEAQVGGWVVWHNPDTVIDANNPVYSFLNGDARLRIRKFKKQISQGLALPLSALFKDVQGTLGGAGWTYNTGDPANPGYLSKGQDVTDLIKIIKYEKTLPITMLGIAKGNFPSFLIKTDEDNLRSNPKVIDELLNRYCYATKKIDGCLPRQAFLPIWGGGSVTMGELFKKQKVPILIGVDKKGRVCPAHILDVYRNGTKNNWLDISIKHLSICQSGFKGNRLRITANHKVYTNLGWKEAGNIKVGDTLYQQYESLSYEQRHVIYSGLLGDGSVTTPSKHPNFLYIEGHKEEHLEYTRYIQKLLGDIAKPSLQSRISGFGSKMRVTTTKQHYDITEIRRTWYPKGKKRLPADLTWMDDFSIAKWYMDDGSRSHHQDQQDRACFATNCFSKEEVKRLSAQLEQMYKVRCSVYFSKGWSIRVNTGRRNEIDTFWKRIASHICPVMRYKLPEKYRKIPFKPFKTSNQVRQLKPTTVTKIVGVPNTKAEFSAGRQGFDIQTSTGNYFVSGLLVHNCSATFYVKDDQFGVCSRNMDLKDTETSVYWKMARQYDIENLLKKAGKNVSIQAECYGEGIQGNKLNIKGNKMAVFNLFDIDKHAYADYPDLLSFCKTVGLPMVEVIWAGEFRFTLNDLIEMANKQEYAPGVPCEGVVIRPCLESESQALGHRLSCKVISEVFALKNGE